MLRLMSRLAFVGFLVVAAVGRLGDEHQGVLSAADGASIGTPVDRATDAVKALIDRCPASPVPAAHYELKKDWAIGTLAGTTPYYFKWISNTPPSVFKATGFVPNNRDELTFLAGQNGDPPTLLMNSVPAAVCRLWFAFPATGANDVSVPKALKLLYDKPKYVYIFTVSGNSIGYYFSMNGVLNAGSEVAFPFTIPASSISVYDTATQVTTPLTSA